MKTNERAQYLFNKTRDDYDLIAADFSHKRNYLSEDLLVHRGSVEKGSRVLDLGCGNGRLSELWPNDKVDYTGADISNGLLNQARERYPHRNFVLIEPVKLPFDSGSFDTVFSLAVFHHIPTTEGRLQSLREIHRVLRPGGRLILTVWYLRHQPKILREISKYYFASIFTKSQLERGDIYLPFCRGDGKVAVNRYIHCYTKKEIVTLIKKAGFTIQSAEIRVRGRRKLNKNIIVIAKRT